MKKPYDHHGLTKTQRSCRTALTMGKEERDMTNYVAKYKEQRKLNWERRNKNA